MPVDLAKIKNDLAKFSSGNFWKPKTGKNYIRILPPWREDVPVYYHAVHLHWVSNRYVLCSGSGCLICSLLKDSAFAVVLRDKVQTVDKFLVNMVDLENLSAGVQVWGMPITVWRALNQYFLDPKWGDLTDLNSGRNITIVREGTGSKDTKYQIYPDPDPTPFDVGVMSQARDLSTIFEELSFDEISALLQSENVHLTPNPQGLPQPEVPLNKPLPQGEGEFAPQTEPPSPQKAKPSPSPQAESPSPSPQAESPSPASQEGSSQFDPRKMQELLNKLMNR